MTATRSRIEHNKSSVPVSIDAYPSLMRKPPRYRRNANEKLSRDFCEIRLAPLGERRKRFACFAGLQALPEQRALAPDLGGDLFHVAHQRLGVRQRTHRPFCQSLGGGVGFSARVAPRHPPRGGGA